ncbi:TetR/AcrR family transcriptional regulator [Albibacterium bauzanense]|uniref:TetR family transcriptional regulator n=1 Tax=Albibacterium bauzanense TaxID=653929 RepID=A0A4R1M2X8_9SPHI|nr:TetR/AcrR family transcriptional regulator [Albibacterium bauzanense]TCK85184.1 TetR family transcriptional regulator [Albibacterium bauzanense]
MDKEKIDKKERILDVAERMFSDLGYDGASTRIISKEAGVNMAMLNYYFGSKDGLFTAVFERRVSTFRATLQNINNENITSWEKLQRCVDYYIDRIISNSCFHKLIHRELSLSQRSELTKTIIDILSKNVIEVKKIITDGIDNGSFKADIDVEMVIATLFGTKYYILNTPQMSSAILERDVENEKVMEEELKPRMKSHLKNLFKAYLLNEDYKNSE